MIAFFFVVLNDLRYAFRQLKKRFGFTLVCVLILAFGIGANTVVFSVMNAVLLRSLSVVDLARVFYLRISGSLQGMGTIDFIQMFSYLVYDALRWQTKVMQVMVYVLLSTQKVAVRYGAQFGVVYGEMVSGSFFFGLGVKLARGCGFIEQEEIDHVSVGVISDSYWIVRFARNLEILGQMLYVNCVLITIVGIVFVGFEGTEGGVLIDFCDFARGAFVFSDVADDCCFVVTDF